MGILFSMFSYNVVSPHNYFIENFVKSNSLSQEVTIMIDRIKNSSRVAYEGLIKELHLISDLDADSMCRVYLKSHHFDTVVRILVLQS